MTLQNVEKLDIYSINNDRVVSALVATGESTYKFALENLIPLVDRLAIQRRIQNPRFYDRLKKDIIRGCLMPPITIAFIHSNPTELGNIEDFKNYINQNIDQGFVLDGIQRLSTLERAFKDTDDKSKFPISQPIFVNIIVCKSMDNLLYRMITLNNGQKPMTTRHQIEILSTNLFEFSDEIDLLTERSGRKLKPGVFGLSDFVLSYMAFLSNSINIDSQKLIQEKLDELLANKILEQDPTDDDVEFKDVIDLIRKLASSPQLDKWFRVNNNLIGFCSEIKSSYNYLLTVDINKIEQSLAQFEESLKSFDVSKIKLGKVRRITVAYYTKHIEEMINYSSTEITDKLVSVVD